MLWDGRLVVPRIGIGLPGSQGEKDGAEAENSKPLSMDVQIFRTDTRDALAELSQTLHHIAFANPRLLPLWSVKTPEMAVFSQDPLAAEFFAKVSAHKVGVLAAAPDSGVQIMFYALDETPVRICAREICLDQPTTEPIQTSESLASLPSVASPQPAIPSPAPIIPSQCGIDGPRKALQQTILGAMRLRGIDRSHRDYKSIYQHCIRAAEFALRNCAQPIGLDTMREKVEALLAVLE